MERKEGRTDTDTKLKTKIPHVNMGKKVLFAKVICVKALVRTAPVRKYICDAFVRQSICIRLLRVKASVCQKTSVCKMFVCGK
jgi:hypothetical protein